MEKWSVSIICVCWQNSVVCFFIRTDLEKFSITLLIITACFSPDLTWLEVHILARRDSLKLKYLNDIDLILTNTAFCFTRLYLMDWSRVDYLWCFYQLFGLFEWTIPLNGYKSKFQTDCYHMTSEKLENNTVVYYALIMFFWPFWRKTFKSWKHSSGKQFSFCALSENNTAYIFGMTWKWQI